MKGTKENLMSKIYSAKVVQVRNKDKDVIVTYRIPKTQNTKVAVFVTNYHENTLPVSTYFDFDELQTVITTDEFYKCCEAAIKDHWTFKLWMSI